MAQQNDCIFCKIARGEMQAINIYENDSTLAFMDINPASDGHALVIPKDHYENLLDITPEALAVTHATCQRVARAIDSALQPDGLRVAQFNGAGAGQTVFHYHVHLRPAYPGQAANIHGQQGDKDKIERIAQRLRSALSGMED